MKSQTIYTVPFRRKRKGVTNYKYRLQMLAAKKPRLVVRKSLKNIHASIIEFKVTGDIIRVAAHSRQLKKHGWNYNTGNVPAAYLVGYSLGKRAVKAGIKEAILDVGLQKATKGSRIYAVLAGAVAGGLTIPHSEDVLPDKARTAGNHIADYAKSLSSEALQKQFSACLKENNDPKTIVSIVEAVKKALDVE